MKYLITGASGFWGYNLTEYILDKDQHADITCIYNTDNSQIEKLNVNCVQCSLESQIETDKLIDNYDCIIHLASIIKHTLKHAKENININVKCCKNMLELANKIQTKYDKKITFILASSVGTVACFNNDQQEANELSKYCNKSIYFPYYRSKMIIEKMANEYANKYFFKLSIIRPPVIYGPKDYKGRATHLIQKFSKSSIALYGSGNIPFCDVRDLCKFTFEIIQKKNPNRVYNIDGCRWSMGKFYQVLEEVSGQSKLKIWVPYTLGYYLVSILNKCFKLPDMIEIEMANSYWNSKSLYNKDFKWTDPRQTLQDTLEWINNSKL